MQIIYSDEHLVAVNKPAGMLVHRTNIDRHETRFAMQCLRDRLKRRVYPVHRLDKPVSGVLLFALTPQTALQLTELFQSRAVTKHYLAVVRGYAPLSLEIDYPLKEKLDSASDALANRNKPPQQAVSTFRRLGTVELPYAVGRYPTARYSILSIEPLTGRKHQIRRHMKHIFHPLVGDTSYGDGRHNVFFRQHLGCQRLLLAATDLHLRHPVTGASLHLRAPLDGSFQTVLSRLSEFSTADGADGFDVWG